MLSGVLMNWQELAQGEKGRQDVVQAHEIIGVSGPRSMVLRETRVAQKCWGSMLVGGSGKCAGEKQRENYPNLPRKSPGRRSGSFDLNAEMWNLRRV